MAPWSTCGNPRLQPGTRGQALHAAAAKQRQAADRAAQVRPYIEAARKAGATTLMQIAEALNARGVRTARGGPWHAATVWRLLERDAGERKALARLQAHRGRPNSKVELLKRITRYTGGWAGRLSCCEGRDVTDDSKVVDLAEARKAKQGDARPGDRTEPADRSAQQGKYLAFLCSHLVDQLDRMKEDAN